MSETRVIALSGLNAVDNPGPGLGVARSLKEARGHQFRIVGLAYDAMEPGVYLQGMVDQAFIMPYPSASADAYLERLLYIREQTGMEAVIPTLDTEIPFYIKHAEVLAAHGVALFLPSAEQYRLRGKEQLLGVAERIGLETPETRVVSSADQVLAAVAELGFPVMVKGSFYKAYRAYTSGEALAHYHQIVAEWGYPVLVQKMISGDEINAVAVGDGEGGVLGQAGLKKMWVTEAGKIWTGVSIRHPRLEEAVARFAAEYRWRGPFEVECMVSGEQLCLVEINPRFPAWSYFATGLGVNLPLRMLRRVLDLPAAAESGRSLAAAPAGKLFIRYTDEVVTDMQLFQRLITHGETEPRA
jgi:carbamoyl-phosphate synthase large subunit